MSHESRLHTASITKLGYIRLGVPEDPAAAAAADGTDPAAEPSAVAAAVTADPAPASGAPAVPDSPVRAVPDVAAIPIPGIAPRMVPEVAATPPAPAPDADASTSEDSVESLAAFLENAVLENAPRPRAPVERATTVSYDEGAERERAHAADSAAPDVARASEPSLAIAVAGAAPAPAESDSGVPNAPASEEKSDIIELPSFTSEETSRPTVQMPPLVIEKEQKALDESFDPSLETSPEPGFDEWPDTVEHALVREPVQTLLGMVPLTVPPRPLQVTITPRAVAAAAVTSTVAAVPAPAAVPTEDTRPLAGITKPPAYDATFDASRLHRSTRPISSVQSTFSDSEVNLIIGSPTRRRWIIAAVVGLIAIIAAGIAWLMFMSVR